MSAARAISPASEGRPLVIIGAGLAGWTAAREFRKLDASTPVLLVTADSGDFYAKPSLSNALAQKRTPAQLVTTAAATMATQLQVTLHAGTRVTSIDTTAQTIVTTGGSFAYRQLVLATGARAIRLPLAGDAADLVHSVNSLDDFSRFHANLTGPRIAKRPTDPATDDAHPAKHVLIMGAGLIGCEFANDLAGTGYQVSVVDPADGPMAGLLPQEASAELRAALTNLGVDWNFGATVTAVNRSPGGGPDAGQPALQAVLSTGVTVPADLVLSAIGLRADIALAQAAGLRCERGIVVDATLQTSAAQVYALGDGAQYASAGGRTLPYVMPIMHAAKSLATTLTGQATKLAFPLMPVLIKTPALPTVVAAPAPGTPGVWGASEPGLWHFIDAQGQRRGFVLTGLQAARRAEQISMMERGSADSAPAG